VGVQCCSTISSATPELTPADNTASAISTVNGSANLAVTIAATPQPVSAGANLTYIVTGSNAGPSLAQAVVVGLSLPAGTTLVSATPSSGTCVTTNCTFAGTMASGGTVSVVYAAQVGAGVASGSSLLTTATISSTTSDPVPANNTSTVTRSVVASADLQLTLSTSSSNLTLGAPFSIVATSTNQGPSDAQDVIFRITLPAGLGFVSAAPSAGGVCITPVLGVSGVITCTYAGATAAGAIRTITAMAAAQTPGRFILNASTSSTTTDPTPANNAATLAIQRDVAPIPALDNIGLWLMGLLFASFGLIVVRRMS